jgi:hypothetical protein
VVQGWGQAQTPDFSIAEWSKDGGKLIAGDDEAAARLIHPGQAAERVIGVARGLGVEIDDLARALAAGMPGGGHLVAGVAGDIERVALLGDERFCR